MNRVILIGRLTREPEIRYAGDTLVAHMTLAVDRRFQDATDFINCTAFKKTAAFVEKYLNRGTKVAVEGRWQTGSYEKNGKTYYTNECIIENVEFAESKKASEQNAETTNDGFNPVEGATDEQLPFI